MRHRSVVQSGADSGQSEISVTLVNELKRKHKKKEHVSFSCFYACVYFKRVTFISQVETLFHEYYSYPTSMMQLCTVKLSNLLIAQLSRIE